MSTSLTTDHMPLRVVMMGASGAVGAQVVAALQATPRCETLTLLNRRPLDRVTGGTVHPYVINVEDPSTYQAYLAGHHAAVCTLGVGQPSAVSAAEFVRVDRDAVAAFAVACKQAGIAHFSLLSSVGADASSRSFYLRTKGELINTIVALGFARVSIFHPSMILTPTNRYGVTQGLMLAVWPSLGVVLQGPLRKYRGISDATLGTAIAENLFTAGGGVERLHWDQCMARARRDGTP
jgi:uncharacterized protein YbjT (DUF2867 family)